ncbi:methyltransferase [Sporosarcina sp. HYO08]|uniref:methyltransferase n=1 Tax=Sporosarcina sp. HYO08 TaxID=1759557 RepID=UPI00079AF04B|nr:methyltransferase [Sporosarcina sp. HYO08]KXH80664.1 SAM-dependent methyltransferase [Sporosarcina sp. HYO08]
MDEKSVDRMLRIQTVGVREWHHQSSHYNRYEATPYVALEALFDAYPLKKTGQIVDFGCGKGRLAFYVHHRLDGSITGVEMNGQLFRQAMENLVSYTAKKKSSKGVIRFEQLLAENYNVERSDQCFYFFNPFSIQIFRKVVYNILHSVETDNRTVDIILYYPTDEYIEFLEDESPFERLMEVQVPGLYEMNANERFLLFRLK